MYMELQFTHHPIEPDSSHAAVADKELVSSSVLSQHPDTSAAAAAAAADGVIHSVTGVGSGGEVAVSVGGGGEDDLPVAAKRVLFVLACASAGLLVLAVSVGVVCRVQCKMQRSADGRAAPSGCGSGSIASARDGRGPPGSMWTTELLRSNQVLLSLNCWQPRINSSFLDVVVCPFVLGGPAGYWESFRVFTLFRTCFMTQPVGRATYCQSKARYSWNIFRKISPYKLPDRPVRDMQFYDVCTEGGEG